MEVTGRVIARPKTLSGATWKKVFIVVRYEEGQYPKDIMLSNMKKPEDFDRIRVGDKGTFKFDANCRDSGDRWFCDLNCWSWKVEGQQQPASGYNEPF